MKICVLMCVLMAATSVFAGPIKGLVDIGTGMEIPDADARYFTQAELTNTAAGSEGIRKVGALGGYTLEHFMEETGVRGISRDLATWTYTLGYIPSPSLEVSWTIGDVYDADHSAYYKMDAGSNTLTDSAVNWAYWDYSDPTVMQWSTGERPFGITRIIIARFSCSHGAIISTLLEEPVGDIVLHMDDGHAGLMPSIVKNGLVYSASGTALSNIIMSAGVEYQDVDQKILHAAQDLSNPAVTFGLVAYHHAASAWSFTATNALPVDVWDNGTDLVATDTAKYYRGLFVSMPDNPLVQWVVPDVEYASLEDAQAGADPDVPPGWDPYVPYCTAYIYKGDDTLLNTSSAYWLDRRFQIRRGTLATGGGSATPTLNQVLIAGSGTGGILPTGMGLPTTSDQSASKGYVDQEAADGQTALTQLQTIYTNQEAVAFSASAEEDWAHTNLTLNLFDITRGRLWVSDTNNTPFDNIVTLTWYVTSDRRGEDAMYRADNISLVQVLANGAVTAGANTITVDDGSSFSANQLVVIYDADSSEFARIEYVMSNILTFEDNLVSDVDDNAGVSRVAEYGGFGMHGSNQTVWARATFDGAKTVNLSSWMEYIR